MIYRYEDDFQDFVVAKRRGEVMEIDHRMYYYWLEVLPPIYPRNNPVTLPNGRKQMVEFGQTEGEPPVWFWIEEENGRERFFCCNSVKSSAD